MNDLDRRNEGGYYKSKAYNMKFENQDDYLKNPENYENEKKYSQEKEHNDDVSVNFARYDDQENELYYEETTTNSEDKYEIFAEFVSIETSCLQCKKVFSSRNKLHKHLKTKCKSIKATNKAKSKEMKSVSISIDKEDSIIIKSTAFKIDKKYDLVFRK
jgi:hypothetical protein